MTQELYKSEKLRLNNKVDTLSNELNSYDWRNENIRLSDEFQAKKQEYNIAFKELTSFNKTYNKKFNGKR